LAGATEARRLPAAAVPAGAVPPLAPAAGAVGEIGAGEVVTAARVGGPAARRVAGRLPAGMRAVVVPLEARGLPVQAGDRVDLLASSAGDVFDAPAPSGPVARSATVVGAAPGALVVALDPAAAVAVAAALGRGPLVPALVSAAED
jgi:hypothetical protein